MPNKSREKAFAAGTVAVNVLLPQELYERMLKVIAYVQLHHLPGWVKLSTKTTPVAMFVRNCIESTCDAMEGEYEA